MDRQEIRGKKTLSLIGLFFLLLVAWDLFSFFYRSAIELLLQLISETISIIASNCKSDSNHDYNQDIANNCNRNQLCPKPARIAHKECMETLNQSAVSGNSVSYPIWGIF